ncbi:hypothetical protein DFP72DRAFT_846803 [Ephemerocybe angulata]|uniref:RING-type domain-containing protein n=1 Tax=Ephemerocybe angulata TaxID=980116 RepID=A0A8H6I079_9AGAR|nr:hypothetical protein DFP72DRAFT_846803 [Tulosesus angulatus]
MPLSIAMPPKSLQPTSPPGTSSQLRNLVPVRGFVHEILRCSRTSGCVLQTALYLEATPEDPGACSSRANREGYNGEPELGPRFFQATEEEIEQSRREEALELSVSECEPIVRFSEDENEVEVEMMDTVRVEVDEDQSMQPPDAPSMNQQQSASLSSISTGPSSLHIEETESTSTNTSTASSPLIPSPIADLPSPLLCPRRAFLAALIPASKFTQDKCYSNRAWPSSPDYLPGNRPLRTCPWISCLLHDTRGSMNSAFFDDASQSGVFFNRGCVSTGSSRSPDFRVRLQTLAAGADTCKNNFALGLVAGEVYFVHSKSSGGGSEDALLYAQGIRTKSPAAAAAAAGDSECRLDRATSASRSTPDDAATEPGAEWDNERDRLTTPDLLQAEPSSSTPSNAISLEDSQVIPRPPAHRTSTMLLLVLTPLAKFAWKHLDATVKRRVSISCGHVFCVDCLSRVTRPACPLCCDYLTRGPLSSSTWTWPSSPAPNSNVTVSDEEDARRLREEIDNITTTGCTESQYKMLSHLCDIKTTLRAQKAIIEQTKDKSEALQEKEAFEKEKEALKAEIEMRKKSQQNSLKVEEELREHCPRAHEAYTSMINMDSQWTKLNDEVKRLRMPSNDEAIARSSPPALELDHKKLIAAAVQRPTATAATTSRNAQPQPSLLISDNGALTKRAAARSPSPSGQPPGAGTQSAPMGTSLDRHLLSTVGRCCLQLEYLRARQLVECLSNLSRVIAGEVMSRKWLMAGARVGRDTPNVVDDAAKPVDGKPPTDTPPGLSDYAVQNEFQKLVQQQQQLLPQAKADAGIPGDKDVSAFTMNDKRKILEAQQLQNQQQQQQQQLMKAGKRNSTSPGEEGLGVLGMGDGHVGCTDIADVRSCLGPRTRLPNPSPPAAPPSNVRSCFAIANRDHCYPLHDVLERWRGGARSLEYDSPSPSERENAEGEETPEEAPPPKELPEELQCLILLGIWKSIPENRNNIRGGEWTWNELGHPPEHSFMVPAEDVEVFTMEVEEYTSVFWNWGGISFGEIRNLDIHPPNGRKTICDPLLRALSALRPLTQLKISSEGNMMEVEDYLEDVASIIRCLPQPKVLTLKLPVPEYDIDEDFKLRTGFPVFNDDSRIRTNEERAWHRKLVVSHVPSLKQIGDGWVMGYRKLWYKEGGIWHNGTWLFPQEPSKRRKRMMYVPRGRSTRKEAFDAWESDSEWAAEEEYGCLYTQAKVTASGIPGLRDDQNPGWVPIAEPFEELDSHDLRQKCRKDIPQIKLYLAGWEKIRSYQIYQSATFRSKTIRANQTKILNHLPHSARYHLLLVQDRHWVVLAALTCRVNGEKQLNSHHHHHHHHPESQIDRQTGDVSGCPPTRTSLHSPSLLRNYEDPTTMEKNCSASLYDPRRVSTLTISVRSGAMRKIRASGFPDEASWVDVAVVQPPVSCQEASSSTGRPTLALLALCLLAR